jgi:hypothetical protein
MLAWIFGDCREGFGFREATIEKSDALFQASLFNTLQLLTHFCKNTRLQ